MKDLHRCENMRADITSRTCLLNQAKDAMEHGRFHCSECAVGMVIRENNGGELPKLRKTYKGYEVVREKNMAQLVKVDGNKVYTTNGQPLSVSIPSAANQLADALSPKIARPCRNHPDRESIKGHRICRECARDYAKEWARKKANKKPTGPISATTNDVAKINPEPQRPPTIKHNSVLETQVGGSHYKDLPIQPAEFCHKNGIGFIPGNIIKYLCRYQTKGGIEDLEKAQHYLKMMIELEGDK